MTTANFAMNVQDYLKWDKSPETHNEIKQLFDSNSPELEARMKRLEFGTAGLRGRMGAGYNCMNPLVILQTTQGLAQYLIKQPNAIQRGVVVGHDHRHNSSLYARITASVFLHFGFKVYYFDSLVHTPLVPFGVGYFGCCAGVMITASHNPKDDNGYKLYWENGVQIIPPHDSCIAASILENLEPVIDTYEIQGVEDASTCIDAYFVKVKELVGTVTKGAKICYTPMHGVGYDYAKRAFQECGLDAFYAVPLQSKPDPDFPTVVFPNPEEKGALDMAIKYANEQGCDLVFANDPDADRFAMAEKVDDTWFVFNGNQIGILLAEFLLLQSEKKKWAVLTTTVSSRMLKSFAEYHSIYYDDTLTGFKWLGNRADELIKEGYHVLFAYEEAIGYMPTTIVKDKDGISAMCVAAKHAHNIYQQGKKMVDVLKECQTKYGTFVSNNGYLCTLN
jgi:phosphomannomutase